MLVATGTAYFVNKINNSKLDNVSREMEEAELPLVYCELGNTIVNQMAGYTQVMSTCLMRDSIIPLNEEYGVDLLVDDEAGYGSTYSYELRRIDGDSLVEEGELSAVGERDGYAEYQVRFRMDMQENQEYVLVFIITDSQGESARYYTRVVNVSRQYAREIIDYSMKFHSTTFVKEVNEKEGNMVYDRLRVTGAATDYDLSHVNLNAPYAMVSWGNLNPIVMTGIVPRITELDNDYAVIELVYVMQSINKDNYNYYNVKECYSAQYNPNTKEVELLAFDRYIDSIFDETYVSKEKNSISMGIANKADLEYVTTEDNKKVAFAKGAELWYYDYNKATLTGVFSFPQKNYSDVRVMNRNVDINIVDMNEAGDIYFVVYGYMSRGKHEGKNGISLYHFSAESSKIEEKIFIQVDEPYDVMKQETGRFTYYDQENNIFYYLLDGAIYSVDINSKIQDTMCYGLPTSKYMVSENRAIVAYPDNSLDQDVTSIIIHNFETGEEYVESGNTNDRYLALGFVGNDLIFGVAKKNDITISSSGEAILPMYKLFIVSPEGEVIKEYSSPGIYIMNAQVQTEKIYLTRATKQNNFFEESQADYISYKADNSKDSVNVSYSYDNYAYNQLDMVFPSNIYISDSVKPVMTKNKTKEDLLYFQVDTTTDENAFYVFNNQGYVGAYGSAGRAIVAVADEKSGLVVDSDGNTVYRNLAATSYNTVAKYIDEYPCKSIEDTLMTCAYMCVEYVNSKTQYADIMACESWEEAFDEYTLGVGINISGISLDVALYFLDRDVPFAACIDDGRYVLVISYNSTHIRYYDPILDEEVRVTRKEFEEALSLQGNTMYTYTSQ